jgi:hypothetical protein
MERGLKRSKIFITSELKTLFKHCFRNPLYTQVPFEIWLDIVWKMPLKTIFTIAASSKAFKELVDRHLKRDMRFALLCRREDQIPVAKKCLEECAKDGNTTAIMHMILASGWGGWGLSNGEVPKKWIETMAENGNVYTGVMLWACGDMELEMWLHKTPIWILICHIGHAYVWKGDVNKKHVDSATEYLEPLANDGEEFAQALLGIIHSSKDRRKSFYWFTKAAEQGNYMAINQLSFMYSARDKKEVALFEKYSYKARIQNPF